MKVDDAAIELERHFAKRGEMETALTPAGAVRSMFAFYRDVRAQDCRPGPRGDMLLFQRGTYDWGQGPRFEFDITRQFIVGDGEDDDITQLHLTFRFAPDEALGSLGDGDRWCSSPAELPDFVKFLERHPAYSGVGNRTDGEQDFVYEGV